MCYSFGCTKTEGENLRAGIGTYVQTRVDILENILLRPMRLYFKEHQLYKHIKRRREIPHFT